MRHLRVLTGAAAICAAFTAAQPAHAGFGLLGGRHHGAGAGYGSTGGGYGSSGGYVAAAYGSSGGGYASGSSTGGASYGGSSGGLGSSGSYAVASAGYGSSGGATGGARIGFLQRLKARHQAHRAAKVSSYGSSGGVSYGSSGGVSYGSSGGVSYGSSGSVAAYSPSYGSTGGSSGGGMSAGYPATYGHSYGPVMGGETIIDGGGYDSGTVTEPAPATSVPQTPPQTPTEASIDRDAALLTVAVPESAKVTVNGLATSSQGPVRQFMSNGLKEGFLYTYVVDVTYPNGAQAASKTVKLRAGAIERLVFDEPAEVAAAPAVAAPVTVVTVRVPADSKVNLAGNDTHGAGLVRTFRTRQLAEGQKWSNYTIRVTSMIAGVPVSKEKTLDLKAGESHDFAFDFDNESIAQR